MVAIPLKGLLTGHPVGIAMLAILFLVVMAFLNLRRRKNASTRRHRRYRATADRVLNKLTLLPGDGQRLTYLRKVSPYVFEELLLSAFERQGLTVVRNASYSGDGGLDGQVIIDGEHWLIQAKRYSRAVSPAHVEDFDRLLLQSGRRGLFVHTGRTGKMSRSLRTASPRLRIISGQRLLAILAGQDIRQYL
ncbi:restriction endonuclease [Salmonella enterica subsp. enterica serovar Typhimurium]|uniref:restriction endonuclease n=1 Tax=Enterobacteriaceae TaxID=543 RepID=UPI00073560D5|nr:MULTISPECIES: restriction endonuclease [Enterobacteriaceae]EBD1155453.1 restriction endonuclease [Salmonella enterica subsp. enterica serovar Uganda]EBI0198222.1 restriction endonuclease [Salmonella enterica subsp. enterica serovar Liverpool]ECU6890434.1 restriction endonuclease [Salmonella enterica subsp. enterica serovar Muenster]EDW7034274.1 restriction endonuclease [Salmonella enterica subsp. enterica serovar 4,[5],12:i:-]EEJ2831228.1 restriction endonuclease [Salmonella enterica subsp.